MPVELFSEPLRRRYYASYFSLAYLFFLTTVFILVGLPFFLSYSPTFWLKTSSYRSQLKSTYSHKIIVTAEGPSGTVLAYSSMPSVNKFHDTYRAMSVSTLPHDNNFDGIMDEFDIEISIPLRSGEEVSKVDVMVFFSTMVMGSSRMVFESPVHFTFSSGLSGSSVYASGNLDFLQSSPLPTRGGYVTMYENDDLLDPTLVSGPIYISDLLPTVAARNYTQIFTNTHSYWTPATTNTDRFSIKTNIKIPVSDVLYIPAATEVLRNAWVTYVSIFIVTAFFLEKLCSFVYFHQIVDTKMLVETVGSNVGVPHFKKF